MDFWQRKGLVSFCLLPFSLLYALITTLRRWLYRTQIFKTTRVKAPVIVVGNLTTGGTGKTPLVIYLVTFLKQAGFKPGIVSRGFGGKATNYPLQVGKETIAQHAGDEALVIHRQTACPMVVDPNRVRACQTLLASNDVDIIISDDGLQHYALAREIEIVVVDGERRFGNQWLLPAGPLREGLSRLNSVDFVVSNGVAKDKEYSMQLKAMNFVNLKTAEKKSLEEFNKSEIVHAVAGLGNPQRFFASLETRGLQIKTHRYADHYAYQATDLEFGDNNAIVMTEKDAVKCFSFAKESMWYLQIEAELPEMFSSLLLSRLSAKQSL